MKILVSSIKQRDVDHFEMVYNYYMPVLYRFAMQYAYDSETAKDLVHDAFAWARSCGALMLTIGGILVQMVG